MSDSSSSLPIGKLSILLAVLQEHPWRKEIEKELTEQGCLFTIGRVGAMDITKVVVAMETAAKNNHIIDSQSYREVHAVYHAIIEAIQGLGRGVFQFGDILRTVGLTFAIVRGKMEGTVKHNGEWIAVCVYGTIGAPKKGFEHEAIGFGFNHI
ncbi:hut operon transcriptional regulator HutP [Paenibacillus sp. DMB20]|uniref:hut operon transcriptional regulator HutP n=1 Tax=Paenibacillus sp. DMB20 TaxID=1642570 RepID=UPI0006275B8A|nr:hut operon transcriptional regulator HutP [Paenibacillus sp. DMB20]KKO51244.1 Hut operon positive regulatory protein [Paenibacillus sp. DMB20]